MTRKIGITVGNPSSRFCYVMVYMALLKSFCITDDQMKSAQVYTRCCVFASSIWHCHLLRWKVGWVPCLLRASVSGLLETYFPEPRGCEVG